MRYRTLGGTGIEVSAHCLGTMMFGAVGNPDHDDCARIIHPPSTRASTSSTPPTCTRAGESEEIVGKALQGPPRRRRSWPPRCTSRWARAATGAATRDAGSSRGRGQPAPAADRLDRPVPDPPAGPHHRHRGDPVGADRSGPPGKIRAFGCSTFPAEQIVEAHHVAERRGLGRFRTEQPPYSMLARGIEADAAAGLPAIRDGRADLEPAGLGFLSGRCRKDQPVDLTTGRAALTPVSSIPTNAGNAAKLDAVEQLVDARRRASAARCPSWRWRSSSPTRRHVGDHRPAHDGAAGAAAEGRRRSPWTTRRWTGSTRSCRPGPTSTTRMRRSRRTCSPNGRYYAAPLRNGPRPTERLGLPGRGSR